MSKKIIATSFLFFLMFAFFSFLVHLGIFNSFDFDSTVKFQDKIPGSFTFVFSLLSLIASAEVATLFLLVLLLILRGTNKFFALFLYGSMTLIELLGKFYVDHKGPPFMFFKYDIGFYFPSTHVQPGSSYPSGHMARTAFIAALLFIYFLNSQRFSREAKFIVFVGIFMFSFFVFVSRVYLGEHWITDVIGGVLIGTSFGLLSMQKDVYKRAALRLSTILR